MKYVRKESLKKMNNNHILLVVLLVVLGFCVYKEKEGYCSRAGAGLHSNYTHYINYGNRRNPEYAISDYRIRDYYEPEQNYNKNVLEEAAKRYLSTTYPCYGVNNNRLC